MSAFRSEVAIYHIPTCVLTILAIYTSLVELFGGVLLIVGLFTQLSLLALSLDLLLVTFAFSLIEPMWNTKHVYPRVILISILWALQTKHPVYNLDTLFFVQ